MSLSSMGHSAMNRSSFRRTVESYVFLRSLVYSLEGMIGPFIEFVVNQKKPRLLIDDPELFKAARRSIEDLLKRDVKNIADGIYPLEVLRPESPIRHFLRFPEMFKEGLKISRRRSKHQSHEFSKGAMDLLEGMPEYYRRNFHFQDDGYLSDRSARLYDHQVNVLFAGAADAMRRMIISPMREKFGPVDGEGLTFLEVGAGTGSATRFVRLAFPKAKIVAVDLSAPYLKRAQENLRQFPRHDFVEANASDLPFKDGSFDAAYSVFLFHELPFDERKKVLEESLRVLREGGFIGLVDSLQLGDEPEMDRALLQFPREFHEPFYRNYASHPMETMLASLEVRDVEVETGFFSKVCWGAKRSE